MAVAKNPGKKMMRVEGKREEIARFFRGRKVGVQGFSAQRYN